MVATWQAKNAWQPWRTCTKVKSLALRLQLPGGTLMLAADHADSRTSAHAMLLQL